MENTKNSLFSLLLIFAIILTFFNCGEINKDDSPQDKPVEAPTEIVSVDEARTMYKTYEARRVQLIQHYEDSIDGYSNEDKIQQKQIDQTNQADPNDPNGKRFDVARYVYWDYKTIKNYLKYIEQEAEAADVEISTLRFYFSNYDENPENVHPRQNSIMISPTLEQNGREYIFEIDDQDPENQKPILLTDSFGPVKSQEKGMGDASAIQKKAYASFIPNTIETTALVPPYYQGKSVTMNKGSGAPPPYHEE